MVLQMSDVALRSSTKKVSIPSPPTSPDYARWLPILRNQLKDMNFPESAVFSHLSQRTT
jgi:hypothetical protein